MIPTHPDNAKGYLQFSGWWALAIKARHAIAALNVIVDEERARKNYGLSDRLRTISAELKLGVDYVAPSTEGEGKA